MIEIRSYRRVFDLERRLYRVDRLRLNPGGISVLGIAYFLVALSVLIALSALPVIGGLTTVLPWYLRYVAIPAGLAALLGVIRVEGRPFHLAALALVRFGLQARRVAGARDYSSADERWQPDDVVFLPDGSDSRMRKLRYRGPGAAVIAVEHDLGAPAGRRLLATRIAGGRDGVTVRERPGGGRLGRRKAIVLAAGAHLQVRPAARRRRRDR